MATWSAFRQHFAYGVILLVAAAAARLAIISSTWKQFSFHGVVSLSNSSSNRTPVTNETFDPPWTVNVLPDSASTLVNGSTTDLPSNRTFPNVPSKGLIVIFMMGRLGNNLFQLGFARILAKRLGGWQIAVIYNHDSQFVDLSSKSAQCFPNALPDTANIEPDLATYLNVDESTTQDLGGRVYGKVQKYWRLRNRVWRWVANQKNT